MASKKDDAGAPGVVTFCDKTHAKRSLFMPDGRELKVARGRLEVKPDDEAALAFLGAREDFERLASAG